MKCTAFLLFLFAIPLCAQTYNTSCVLYPNAAYCTTTTSNGGSSIATAERQQQYQAGQAVGSAIGMGIYRKMFPGWRRKYCSTHPEQPFYYGNSRGDSITGTCPSLDQLTYEAAAEFHAKHPDSVKSADHAQAIVAFIADHKMATWEPKSYEKAAKATDPDNQKKKEKKS